MKTWKKLTICLVFPIVTFLLILAIINFSAYDFSGERNIYVQIAVDKEYLINDPHAGFRIPKMLEDVSDFYWKKFKIRLIMPRPENYDFLKSKKESENTQASFKELNLLSKSFPEGDIIIGFTGRKLPEPNNEMVYADADSFMVFVTNLYPPKGQIQLIKHELAHLFLAKHISGTIMDEKPTKFAMNDDPTFQNFSNLNKTIIKYSRYKNFKMIKFFYRIDKS